MPCLDCHNCLSLVKRVFRCTCTCVCVCVCPPSSSDTPSLLGRPFQRQSTCACVCVGVGRWQHSTSASPTVCVCLHLTAPGARGNTGQNTCYGLTHRPMTCVTTGVMIVAPPATSPEDCRCQVGLLLPSAAGATEPLWGMECINAWTRSFCLSLTTCRMSFPSRPADPPPVCHQLLRGM